MALTLQSTKTLANGVEVPVLGLGVFRSESGTVTQTAVRAALEAGYRHVDTAKVYGNERDVGIAFRDSGLPREQVFITTKLWNTDHGYESALRACSESLQQLQMDYVDLYLIHWPVAGLRQASWKALEKLLADGYCRAIGVSNFTVRHLRELLPGAESVPMINQVESHPLLTQEETRAFCREQGIAVEAYSPLTKGLRLGHPAITQIARKYERSSAQILIRWGLQRELVVLPKSTNPERVRQNAQVFDFALETEDMRFLDSLNEDLYTGWNPTDAP